MYMHHQKVILRVCVFINCLILVVTITPQKVFSQETIPDTLSIDTSYHHSPGKAALLSTILPGMGQIYNRKHWKWKVPLIYAGLGASLSFAVVNHREFKRYRTAYQLRLDNDSTTIDEFAAIGLTDAGIESNIDLYKSTRDLFYIITGLVYVLNIIDANVQAHLFHFPVNDNLSLHIQPDVRLTTQRSLSKGFSLVLHL